MQTNVEAFFTRGEINPTKDSPYSAVTYATVREVDLRIRNNKLEFYYSRGKDIDFSNYPKNFNEVLEELCDGTFQYSTNALVLEQPFDSALSCQHQPLGYVIYKLSDKNWQFARLGPPITLSNAAFAKECFFGARRVFYENGQITEDKGGNYGNEKDECKVAYLIADGPKALDPNTQRYADGINFHIDLFFQDTDVTRFIPLVVDPDVRYPGGSNDP